MGRIRSRPSISERDIVVTQIADVCVSMRYSTQTIGKVEPTWIWKPDFKQTKMHEDRIVITTTYESQCVTH